MTDSVLIMIRIVLLSICHFSADMKASRAAAADWASVEMVSIFSEASFPKSYLNFNAWCLCSLLGQEFVVSCRISCLRPDTVVQIENMDELKL